MDGHVALTTPLSGTVCCRYARTAKINLPTKFEVPNFTRYGNMKGVAKPVSYTHLTLPTIYSV